MRFLLWPANVGLLAAAVAGVLVWGQDWSGLAAGLVAVALNLVADGRPDRDALLSTSPWLLFTAAQALLVASGAGYDSPGPFLVWGVVTLSVGVLARTMLRDYWTVDVPGQDG